MDKSSSSFDNPTPPTENQTPAIESKPIDEIAADPSWEKWRSDQVQTISMLLSNIFKVEDEVRQIQSPSRLLRNPARQSAGNEEELCEKLNAIRQQITEYEQVLKLSRKRIENALHVIQPGSEVKKSHDLKPRPISRIRGLKNWMKHSLAARFIRKKAHKSS